MTSAATKIVLACRGRWVVRLLGFACRWRWLYIFPSFRHLPLSGQMLQRIEPSTRYIARNIDVEVARNQCHKLRRFYASVSGIQFSLFSQITILWQPWGKFPRLAFGQGTGKYSQNINHCLLLRHSSAEYLSCINSYRERERVSWWEIVPKSLARHTANPWKRVCN